ncbi:hypothetical protein ABK040_012619 [Willaertia magna]
MSSSKVSESTVDIICTSLEKARNNLKVATKALSACYDNHFDLPEYVVLRTNISSNMHTFKNQKLPLLEVVNRKIIALAKHYYLPFNQWKAKLNEIALCAKSLNEDTAYTSQKFQEMLTIFKQREDECKQITKKLNRETEELMKEAEQKKSTADTVKWLSFIPVFGLIGVAAGQITSSVIDNQANDLKNKSIVMAAIAKTIEEDLVKAVSNVVGCLSEIAGCVSIIETDVRLLSSKTEAIYDNVKLPHYKILNARAKRLDESCSSFNSFIDTLKSSSTLHSGNSLEADCFIRSDNECYTAIMQGDGNFVIYEKGRPVWASNTWHVGVGPHKIVMQDDGNLVIYDKYNNPTWASNTCGVGQYPFRVIMQDDRNLVIYDKYNRATWASNTCI